MTAVELARKMHMMDPRTKAVMRKYLEKKKKKRKKVLLEEFDCDPDSLRDITGSITFSLLGDDLLFDDGLCYHVDMAMEQMNLASSSFAYDLMEQPDVIHGRIDPLSKIATIWQGKKELLKYGVRRLINNLAEFGVKGVRYAPEYY